MEASPIEFEHGFFADTAIQEFKIYNDGVVVSAASNTNILDAFLADVLEWMGTELGLSEIEPLKRGTLYESDLIFSLDIDAEKLVPWANGTEKLLSKKWQSYGHTPASFQFGLTRLSVDPSIGGIVPVGFTLERRAGVAFDKNVYFSSAGLTTDDHLDVLAQLEKLLSR